MTASDSQEAPHVRHERGALLEDVANWLSSGLIIGVDGVDRIRADAAERDVPSSGGHT